MMVVHLRIKVSCMHKNTLFNFPLPDPWHLSISASTPHLSIQSPILTAPSQMDTEFLSSSSSPSPSAHSYSEARESTGGYRSIIYKLFERVVCATVTCIIAIVGSLAGAISGALIGLATESGFLRGAGVGAISGAIFSIEVVESSLELWNSRESGIWSLLYVMDIISSILSGRLVREKVGPAVQSAVQSQMSALSLPFVDTFDIYETGGIKGLSMDEVENLPKIKIATGDNLDSGGEQKCCSVCLQDFQVGQLVRKLPYCHHMFHLPCIDSWLTMHGSCPLCRRVISLSSMQH